MNILKNKSGFIVSCLKQELKEPIKTVAMHSNLMRAGVLMNFSTLAAGGAGFAGGPIHSSIHPSIHPSLIWLHSHFITQQTLRTAKKPETMYIFIPFFLNQCTHITMCVLLFLGV